MKKVRTIQGCYEEIKAADPNTGITLSAVRRAVTAGEIPSRRIGSRGGYKYMVDLDLVVAYCSGEGVS